MYRFFKYAVSVVFLFLATAHMASALSLKDFYMQIGSVAGLAESCYQSEAIPNKLNVYLPKLAADSPSLRPIMKELINFYNEAYRHAIVSHTIWDATQQHYTDMPLDCDNESDVAKIKQLETILLQGFN